MMADEITDIEMPDGQVKVSKTMLSQGVHLGFLMLGALISLLLFLAVQSVAVSILSDDYKRISAETSRAVAKEFTELEFAVRTISTLLALSDENDSGKIVQKLNNVEASLQPFEKLLWLHKNDDEWSLLPLYEDLFNAEIDGFTDVLKNTGVQKAIRNAMRERDKLFLVPYSSAATQKAVFALVKATETTSGETSVLLAFTHLDHVFETRKLNVNELVSTLSIRDIEDGKVFFDFKREKVLQQADYDAGQSFDLDFGARTLEINSHFYKKDDMLLLELMPYFVLGFCLILTFTITLHLRSNHMQALKFSVVNKNLTNKNEALQGEIRKRELLNQTARRADRENRVIIDSVSDIIFEADIDGKILFLNARWPTITGFDIEQSLGLELFKILHPQDQHDVRDDFQSLVQGRVNSFRKFTRIRTSDGTFRAAELSVSMINQDDEDGRRLVGTFTDVEERRRAERALSEAERKYRNIVQNAAGGIFQMTPEGLYLSANPSMADVLGYDSPEQVLREVKNAHKDVYVDTNERLAFIRNLEKSEVVNNHEVLVKRRDGTEIWVNENIHTVRDETGGILYFEGSIEDISVRKLSAIALQEAKMHSDLANRAKSEFLSNMSHELRTPLNSIIGFSEMIKGEVLGKLEQPAYLEYAKDINESGKTLLNVINEILDISKIEAGKQNLNESQIRVDAIAGACIDLLSGKIQSSGITVTNNLAGMPEIIGEDLSIKQVLMNLLSNAVKFTPKGGRVSLSYEVDRDGALHVSVTDTGIGLDESEIQKALSPFGQVDSELDRGGSGTGLGLTLVDALLKLHGAELDLVSQKGIGTTATAIFPKDRVVMRKNFSAQSENQVQDI
ncbi:MAG: PAS domain-containing sensor histidine kinase [Alphaproteobacteria bacterium]|nr:PAS domain-containing sensor histidine kinase [Alphaproteobacteria bacterium]